MKTFALLFPILITFITYWYCTYRNALRIHTGVVMILLLVSGILEIIIGSYQGVIFFFIAAFMGAFYSVVPANDVLFVNIILALFYL